MLAMGADGMIRRYLFNEGDGWPGGLRCMDCDRECVPGDEIADDMVGMIGDTPLNEVICGPCATKRERIYEADRESTYLRERGS